MIFIVIMVGLVVAGWFALKAREHERSSMRWFFVGLVTYLIPTAVWWTLTAISFRSLILISALQLGNVASLIVMLLFGIVEITPGLLCAWYVYRRLIKPDVNKIAMNRKVLKVIVAIGVLVYGYFFLSAGIGFQLSSNTMAAVVGNALSSMVPARKREAGNSHGKGCNQILLENCAGISIPSSYFFDGEALARIMDALEHPCRYLADPNDSAARQDWREQHNNASDWRYFRCESKEIRRFKVVINVYDEQRQLVFRVIKP